VAPHPRRAALSPLPRPVLHEAETSEARSRRVGVRGKAARALPPLPPPCGEPRAPMPLPPPPLRGRVGVGGPRVALQAVGVVAPPKSTSPISTRCTARNPCRIDRAAHFPKSLSVSKAKSSSPPTRINPARNSAPPRAPPAARRGRGVGGRGGRLESRRVLRCVHDHLRATQSLRSTGIRC
jgi:hypothetical protein